MERPRLDPVETGGVVEVQAVLPHRPARRLAGAVRGGLSYVNPDIPNISKSQIYPGNPVTPGNIAGIPAEFPLAGHGGTKTNSMSDTSSGHNGLVVIAVYKRGGEGIAATAPGMDLSVLAGRPADLTDLCRNIQLSPGTNHATGVTGSVNFNGPLVLPTYTKADIGWANAFVTAMVYCPDGGSTGGPALAVHTETAWSYVDVVV